jgi:hypothetical protein
MPLEDIPTFLKLTPEERKAAWDAHKLEAKTIPAVLPEIKRIATPPGAKDADTDA